MRRRTRQRWPRTSAIPFDAESGLHYNYLRDYDPSTGRYIQADPIGQLGGINLYGHVEANPLGMIDPLGLTMFGGIDDANGDIPSSGDTPPGKGPCIRAIMGRGGYIKRWVPCDRNRDRPDWPFTDDSDDDSDDPEEDGQEDAYDYWDFMVVEVSVAPGLALMDRACS